MSNDLSRRSYQLRSCLTTRHTLTLEMNMRTLALLFCLIACGCSTTSKSYLPKKISSTPPAKKLTLKKEFKGKYLVVPYTLPAGDYLPTNENDGGFFFLSEEPLTITDNFFPRKVRGGIYWKKDSDKPEWIYYQRGELFNDHLKDTALPGALTITK